MELSSTGLSHYINFKVKTVSMKRLQSIDRQLSTCLPYNQICFEIERKKHSTAGYTCDSLFLLYEEMITAMKVFRLTIRIRKMGSHDLGLLGQLIHSMESPV